MVIIEKTEKIILSSFYPSILASMVNVFNLIHIAVDPNTTSSSPCSDFAHPTGLQGDQGALPSGFLQ
jgi:hypothetical protein